MLTRDNQLQKVAMNKYLSLAKMSKTDPSWKLNVTNINIGYFVKYVRPS